MGVKKIKLLIILFLGIYNISYSQGYKFHEIIEDSSLTCGQGDIADGLPPDAFDRGTLFISGTGNSLRGVFISYDDGKTGTLISLTPEQLICGHTFDRPVDLSSFCEDVFVDFVSIRPDDNFKITSGLAPGEDTIPVVKLDATPGYHSLVYNWQYLDYKDNEWKNFPSQFLGNSSIDFSVVDLFGNNASEYTNRPINYRIQLCNGWSPPNSIFTFTFIPESPEFINAIPTPTTCNYDEDGSFELIIGRNINADEKLAITIYEKDTGNVPSGGQNLNVRRADLITNSNGTFSYKWPLVLPANTYEIKYQTGRTSEDLSNVFNSLVPVGEVIVKNSKEVTFSLTQASDKTCFSRNDGYIDVIADGEDRRTFFYQLLKDGVVQRVGGQEWIPFTNAKTTRIEGLGEAKYRVKVQDSEKCFFRR